MFTTSLIVVTLYAVSVWPAHAASSSTLAKRELRQHRTIWRTAGTLRFFAHHPSLAVTPAGRGAIRVARVWLAVTRRELAETRAERRAQRPVRSLQSSGDVATVICQVFGPYCSQAIAVARCESGLSVYATNGQYLGLFQEGDFARGRYGFAWDAYTQARSAFAYFRESGFRWSAWECQP